MEELSKLVKTGLILTGLGLGTIITSAYTGYCLTTNYQDNPEMIERTVKYTNQGLKAGTSLAGAGMVALFSSLIFISSSPDERKQPYKIQAH